MKQVYLIHGWGGTPESVGWFGWLKRELKEKGIKVIAPEMPNTNEPKIEEWVDKLKKIVKINKETYFVGGSIGCQAVLRYLEQLPEKTKIKGCVFVAGWFNLLETAYEEEGEKEIAKPWIKTPIDLEKVKKHTKNFLALFSGDDPCVPLSDSKLFKEKLNAKIIIKKDQGHFDETQEIKEIKEIIEFIEK